MKFFSFVGREKILGVERTLRYATHFTEPAGVGGATLEIEGVQSEEIPLIIAALASLRSLTATSELAPADEKEIRKVEEQVRERTRRHKDKPSDGGAREKAEENAKVAAAPPPAPEAAESTQEKVEEKRDSAPPAGSNGSPTAPASVVAASQPVTAGPDSLAADKPAPGVGLGWVPSAETLSSFTKFKEILNYLIDNGVSTADDLVTICQKFKGQVPVLSRITDLRARVDSYIEVYGLKE